MPNHAGLESCDEKSGYTVSCFSVVKFYFSSSPARLFPNLEGANTRPGREVPAWVVLPVESTVCTCTLTAPSSRLSSRRLIRRSCCRKQPLFLFLSFLFGLLHCQFPIQCDTWSF